jgi:hypothetical protein
MAAAMASGGQRAHAWEERGQLFIAVRVQRRPCSRIKCLGALMCVTAVVSACVHSGEATTPRRAGTHRVARGSSGRGGF